MVKKLGDLKNFKVNLKKTKCSAVGIGLTEILDQYQSSWQI